MKETLTLTQIIAEEKRIKKNIENMLRANLYETNKIDLVTYYQKNRPFVGSRTAEEQEKKQKEQFQTLNDYIKRLNALKKAHTKANRETTLMVTAEPTLFELLQGKEPGKEEITIAEAINRKNHYRRRNGSNDTFSMESVAIKLTNIFVNNTNCRKALVKTTTDEVNYQLAKRFPSDSKSNWSQDKYSEVKKQLENEVEIVAIDPYNLVGTSTIINFQKYVDKYIDEIDTLISQVNASTIVEIEY